jgi:type II secretory pathway pseudopilin PulG
LDFPLLWSVINKELGQSGIPDAQQSIQAFRAQFGAMTGVDLDKVIASIGSECGLVITLDEMKTSNPRLPGPAGQMPDLGLMLACQVKNDTIFDMLDSTTKANPQVLRKDKGGLRMRTMPSPMPMPINLRPSFARSGDYFFAATTDSLIETALAVKAGTQPGLKSTDEFKKLSQGIRGEGNSFVFRSGRIAETFARMQSQVMGGNKDPSRTQVLTTLFGSPGTPGTYHVAVNTDEGWLAGGNSGQNPATAFFLLPTVAFTAIVASVAIPSLLRSRQVANETAAVATLRTIASAEVTYMAVSRGGYGNMQALIQAGLLDPRITSSVSGHQFTIEVSGNNYTATATPESPNSGRYSYFVNRDGVVRYSRVPTQAPPGESGNPVQ